MAGNRATLKAHGGDFFPELLAAMDRAKEQITLEYYIVRDDTLGQRFAEAMSAAAGRGVAVYLIYDYVGSFDTPAAYFERLVRNGVNVLCFNRPKFGRVLRPGRQAGPPQDCDHRRATGFSRRVECR